MKTHLKKRQQCVRVNSMFIQVVGKNNFGVPQGLILVPLNIHIHFFYVENSDLSDYADENTSHSFVNNLEPVKEKTLREDFQKVSKWF